mgnify:CR=1 FL=1
MGLENLKSVFTEGFVGRERAITKNDAEGPSALENLTESEYAKLQFENFGPIQDTFERSPLSGRQSDYQIGGVLGQGEVDFFDGTNSYKTVIEPPKFILYLQKILVGFLPSLTLNNRLNPYDLSKNIEIVKKYIEDPLVHNKISLKMFSEVNNAINQIEKDCKKINIPILLIHGKKDKIISFEGTENISKKINDSKLILYESIYHEPHNDLEKNKVMDDFSNFIKNNIDLNL